MPENRGLAETAAPADTSPEVNRRKNSSAAGVHSGRAAAFGEMEFVFFRLALHGAQRHTGDEILLEEGVQRSG